MDERIQRALSRGHRIDITTTGQRTPDLTELAPRDPGALQAHGRTISIHHRQQVRRAAGSDGVPQLRRPPNISGTPDPERRAPGFRTCVHPDFTFHLKQLVKAGLPAKA
jgi:hypothetical protein